MSSSYSRPGNKQKHQQVPIRGLFLILLIVWSIWGPVPQSAKGETPAPYIHWGALSYPDQEPDLSTGLSVFRFTEFNGEGERYNGIKETIGINFVTLSWTQHLTNKLENWSTNFTLGVGPTRNQPTEWLQNDLIHDELWGIPQVPVEETRKQTDFSITGSLTRWWEIPGQKRILYIGGGGQFGSLFHELFARAGFRRWSPLKSIERWTGSNNGILAGLFRPLRLSGMVRASRVAPGAAFHDLANTTYATQGSISYGWYDQRTLHPWVEVEIGATIDSGIFNGQQGDSLEERFWTAALRVYPFTVETWNDQLNSQDFGPTYGARLMMDLSFLVSGS
ncbi:MAG: hypothetical protein R3B74_07065 [Nitrospirales bacterium]|nr:hypothetical protein [Nitrospirales bacterium]